MNGFLESLGEQISVFAVFGTLSIGFIAMAVATVLSSRAKEKTRRELAAYVAEGSMTADEAERILCAGGGDDKAKPCCGAKKRRSSAPSSQTVEA